MPFNFLPLRRTDIRPEDFDSEYADMLEFTLATYEHECLKSRPAKGELDRLESRLVQAWLRVGRNLQAPRCLRINTIQGYSKELGDNATDAIHRFFLENRHSK